MQAKPEEDLLPSTEDLPEDDSDAPAPTHVLQMPEERRALAKRRLAKRITEIHEDSDERRHGPQGEKRTKNTGRVQMLSLEDVVSDNDFKNLKTEPTPQEVEILKESMRREGLKVPIIVVAAPNEKFFVRAGFRRTKCARQLGWSQIPAVVLPAETSEKTEHWVNIVENFTRCRVHPYETAVAAQTMRDKFQVDAREFASRAGYDEKYVRNLLHALDHLPPEIVQRWRERRLVPTEFFIKWSYMTPDEAVKSFNVYAGLHPRVMSGDPPTEREKKKTHPLLMASRAGLRRMQRVWFAIASSPKIKDEARRRELMELVQFCMGERQTFGSIYDDSAKHRSTRGRDSRSRTTTNDIASFQLAQPEDEPLPEKTKSEPPMKQHKNIDAVKPT